MRGEFVPPHHTRPQPAPVPPAHRSFFYFTHEGALATPRNIMGLIWMRADDNATPTSPWAIVAKPLART